MSENIILETKNLTKKFGGLTAVNNLSIKFEQGSLKSIIGPNGSGKTTFFNLITGTLKPSSGNISFQGVDVTGYPMHKLSQIGVSRSYQITNIFPYLTTFENIRLAAQSRGNFIRRFNFLSKAGSYSDYIDKVYYLAELVKLDPIRLYAPASMLPHAEQRKLEVALALATNPKLILLDEPTAGMSVEEIPEIYDMIVRIKKSYGKDLTIIVIEHKMDIVMKISEEVIVLAAGCIIAKGTPDVVQKSDAVLSAYLGDIDNEFA
ncbi:MAG: ABC transporter ATP-binding protein [Candidatus Hodarchaeales archaeon]